MTARGHFATGLLGLYALAPLAGWLGAPVGVRLSIALVVCFGVLAPDLDMPQSYLGRRLFPLPYLVRMLLSNPVTWTVCGLSARPRSRIGWLWWPLRVLVEGRARLRWLVRHRGFSHSLLNAVLVGVVFAIGLRLLAGFLAREGSYVWLQGMTGIGAAWQATAWAALHGAALTYGCLVHLAGDACTKSGVPLWLPFSDRPVHLLPRALRWRTR
ncbi:MAG: metal-dependent hydrolase [Gemmatimonadaceae bacterium]|nr:metal-dependent hydrolase [Gemmatimonadaceae bacterium]